MRWQKWFTATGQTIIVTGQTHTRMHTHTLTYTHNACARAHTHTKCMHSVILCLSLCDVFCFENQSHKITASTSDIHCFLHIIADLNWKNIKNYQSVQTLKVHQPLVYSATSSQTLATGCTVQCFHQPAMNPTWIFSPYVCVYVFLQAQTWTFAVFWAKGMCWMARDNQAKLLQQQNLLLSRTLQAWSQTLQRSPQMRQVHQRDMMPVWQKATVLGEMDSQILMCLSIWKAGVEVFGHQPKMLQIHLHMLSSEMMAEKKDSLAITPILRKMPQHQRKLGLWWRQKKSRKSRQSLLIRVEVQGASWGVAAMMAWAGWPEWESSGPVLIVTLQNPRPVPRAKKHRKSTAQKSSRVS